IGDINSTHNSIELTLSKTEPIEIYIKEIRKKLDESYVFQYILKNTNNEPNIPFFIEDINNRRWKRDIFLDWDSSLKEILDLIKNKVNTIAPIDGKSSDYYFDVLDLIFYFLPATQQFLSPNFDIQKEIIDKISKPNIEFVICKPRNQITHFTDYQLIESYIITEILSWILENVKMISDGVAESSYQKHFLDYLPVPSFSDISDIATDIVKKNKTTRVNFKTQINLLKPKIDNINIDNWKKSYDFHYKFTSYQTDQYSDATLDDIEKEFEIYKYPN
ncbi:unnamed protein product, partial [marine sediment metagenome]